MVGEPGLNLLVEGGGKGGGAGSVPSLGPVEVGGEAVQASDDSKPIFKDTAFLSTYLNRLLFSMSCNSLNRVAVFIDASR